MYFEKNINKDSLTSESSMINPSRVSTDENLFLNILYRCQRP